MQTHPILIVYYSRTGTTRKMVELLKKRLPCDVERVKEKRGRLGMRGYVRSLWEALNETAPEIELAKKDPSDYELTILCCPIWMGRVPSPMRTYLLQKRDGLSQVAFFLTCGGSGSVQVYSQLKSLSGHAAIAEACVTAREIRDTRHLRKLEHFTRKISGWIEKARVAA